MNRFYTRDILVKAFRLGTLGNPTPVPEWFGTLNPNQIIEDGIILSEIGIIPWGNWIIKFDNGKLFTCNHEFFELVFKLIK